MRRLLGGLAFVAFMVCYALFILLCLLWKGWR